MEILLSNAAAGKPRRVTWNGRPYLVVPITSIVQGVLSGSQGSLLYPGVEIGRNVDSWNGMPIVHRHPTDNQGRHVSARSPQVLAKVGMGQVWATTYNGKLQHEGWFDEAQVKAADARFKTNIHQDLTAGKPIEMSTGLFTDNEPRNGTFNGKAYTHVARNYRPDHIAVLPDQRGACSLTDGCGIGVNAKLTGNGDAEDFAECEDDCDDDEDCIDDCLDELAGNANPEGCNQYKDCGGGGGGEGKESGEGMTNRILDRKKQLAREGKSNESVKELHAAIGKMSDSEVKDAAGRLGYALPVKGSSKDARESLKHAIVNAQNFLSHLLNAAPNQTRHESGRYQPYGAGTGKGPEHASAKIGHEGACPGCGKPASECSCDEQETPTSNKGDSDMDRQATISYLTTNCDCWKGDAETLNEFDDARLAKLKANAEKQAVLELTANSFIEIAKGAGAPAGLAVNDMPEFIKKKIAAGDEDDAEDAKDNGEDEEMETNAAGGQKPVKPATVNEWMATAPPEVQSAVRNAMQIERDAKQKLLTQLTANLQEPAKAQTFALLKTKPLDELRVLANLRPSQQMRRQEFPEHGYYQDAGPTVPEFNYAGAGVGSPAANAEDEEGPLPLPTMNFSNDRITKALRLPQPA